MAYTETPSVDLYEGGSNAFVDRQSESITNVLSAMERLSDRDALLYNHADYEANCYKWEKYSNTYEAEEIAQYIFRHTRESEDIWLKRVKRGYYYNYVASVVDLFVAYLFHSPIERKYGDLSSNEDLKSIQENADRHGNTFDLFIQMVSVFAQIHGHCGILVDMPRTPEGGIQSEEERKNLNFRPYFTLLQASQFKDWELDEYDQFEWVKLEIKRPQGRDWRTPVDPSIRNFLIWTKTSWEEWQVVEGNSGEDPKLIASGSHDLGRVPIVIARNERCLGHEWMGLSAVRDIADINIAILNWSSLGDEEIYERCLNILAIERSEQDARVDLSHNNALEFEPGATPPFFLTPGTSPLELISKWIERAKDEIYRLAKMGGASGIKGQQSSLSGIAYAYEFNETNQSLARKAESLEQAETELWRLVAAWMKKDWDGKITYPKEFGVEDFLTEFQILSESRVNFTSETAIKEVEKRLVTKMFAREKQELRDKIIQEIDSGRGVPAPGLVEMFNQQIPASLYSSAKTLPSQDLAEEQAKAQAEAAKIAAKQPKPAPGQQSGTQSGNSAK